MMGLFFTQDLDQNILQKLFTTVDAEVNGGNRKTRNAGHSSKDKKLLCSFWQYIIPVKF
jgi:hypothetical protein